MNTILIQITNQKVIWLLHKLEELHLIKVLKKNIKTENKLSERFAGKLNLSNEEYNQFKKHIHNSRNEWDNRTI